MNTIQKASLSLVAVASYVDSAFAAITTTKPSDKVIGNGGSLVDVVQNIIGYLTTLLYIVAVAYAIYGGFLMLTSGGNEDGVKKGKTILIHGALGIGVIFLASSIVNFILGVVIQ